MKTDNVLCRLIIVAEEVPLSTQNIYSLPLSLKF